MKILFLLQIAIPLALMGCGNKKIPGYYPMDVAAIKKQIKNGENVLIDGKIIEGDLDFTDIFEANLEADGSQRAWISASISFKNCSFLGNVLASQKQEKSVTSISFQKNISFIHCTFEKEANFRSAQIQGLANFYECIFLKAANFEDCQFDANAVFSKCSFKGETRFHNTFFNRKTDFMNATFDTTTYFQGARFASDAQFGVTTFHQYADFTHTHFHQGCYFNYAVFQDRAIFNQSTFHGRMEMYSAEIKTGEMKNCKFQGDTKFQKINIGAGLDCTDAAFFIQNPNTEEGIGLEKINWTNAKMLKKE